MGPKVYNVHLHDIRAGWCELRTEQQAGIGVWQVKLSEL